MAVCKKLRIFIASPSDVRPARVTAAQIIDKLDQDFQGFFEKIEAFLWEHEVMLTSDGHFQDNIDPPSNADIVVLIVWSKLGSLLPRQTEKREYKGIDGRAPVTGTEWEYEDALAGRQLRGIPDILVFRDFSSAPVDPVNVETRKQQNEQLDALQVFWARHLGDRAFKPYRSRDEFAAELEQQLRQIIPRHIDHHLVGDIRWHSAPYRGLEPYEFEHAPIFFGRNGLIVKGIEQLVARAAEGCPFLIVCGSSGSGKSSLVKAGIVARLMRPRRVPQYSFLRRVIFRPADARLDGDLFLALARAFGSQNPANGVGLPELIGPGQSVEALARNLRATASEPGYLFERILGELTKRGRSEAILLADESACLILVIDQFEEMLQAQSISREERNKFFKLLASLAGTDQIWVIATIRADFWDRALEVPGLAVLASGSGRLDVPPPSKAELDEMISKPAEMASITFERDHTTQLPLDRVLAEHAAAEPGVLPLLSFTLDALYKRDILNAPKKLESHETPGRVLTYRSYKELGGLMGAIGSKADEVYGRQAEEVRAALPYVLDSIVSVGVRSGGKATARPVPLAQFAEGTPERELVDAFLAPDARLFVVTGAVGDGGPTVRVAHEALLTHWPRAAKQIADNEKDLRLRERLEFYAEVWMESNQDADYLLPEGRPLTDAQAFAARHAKELSEHLRHLIAASETHANVVAGSRQQERERVDRLNVELATSRLEAPVRGPIRIFISSPADVAPEREIAGRVIQRLDREFARYFRVEGIRWEDEMWLAPSNVRDVVFRPDQADIAVFIFWARIGTPLPTQYAGALSGKVASGTEYEWEMVLASNQSSGKPDVLVFRKNIEPTVNLDDYLRMREQSKRLDAFWNKWMVTPDRLVLAGYTLFGTPEEFEERLYVALHASLEQRLPPEVTRRSQIQSAT
jgi:hypothetical protein